MIRPGDIVSSDHTTSEYVLRDNTMPRARDLARQFGYSPGDALPGSDRGEVFFVLYFNNPVSTTYLLVGLSAKTGLVNVFWGMGFPFKKIGEL